MGRRGGREAICQQAVFPLLLRRKDLVASFNSVSPVMLPVSRLTRTAGNFFAQSTTLTRHCTKQLVL